MNQNVYSSEILPIMTMYPEGNKSRSLYGHHRSESFASQGDVKEDEKLQASSINGLISHQTKTLTGRQRFNLHESVGEGTFGKVWSAQDNDLNRSVAIKGYKGPIEQARYSCLEEVKFVGKLDHPAIPTVYDTGLTEEGVPYIVMKLLKGEPLSEIIKRLQAGDTETHLQYSFEKRMGLIIEVLRAIDSAHKQGILHRDIKPDNILVNPAGHIWLIDWGCAVKQADVLESSLLCGTPLYMPPEQVEKRGLSPATDLFAVGSVAYELISLHRAGPTRSTITEVLQAIPTHKPKTVFEQYHPSQGYPPAEFGVSIMNMLELDMDKRPESGEAAIKCIENSLAGNFKVVCQRTYLKSNMERLMKWVNQNPRPRMRRLKLLVLLITVMLIGGGVLLGSLLASM